MGKVAGSNPAGTHFRFFVQRRFRNRCAGAHVQGTLRAVRCKGRCMCSSMLHIQHRNIQRPSGPISPRYKNTDTHVCCSIHFRLRYCCDVMGTDHVTSVCMTGLVRRDGRRSLPPPNQLFVGFSGILSPLGTGV